MSNFLPPNDTEKEQYVLSLKDGVEIGLGRQDPLIKSAAKIATQYPHHLVLLQAGGFLHAYDRSAYFLHKLKGYKLRIVGPENDPTIRCGLPVIGHKRSLWHVFHDYRVRTCWSRSSSPSILGMNSIICLRKTPRIATRWKKECRSEI